MAQACFYFDVHLKFPHLNGTSLESTHYMDYPFSPGDQGQSRDTSLHVNVNYRLVVQFWEP
jgi:hypothetical protein